MTHFENLHPATAQAVADTRRLLSIPSPTGFTDRLSDELMDTLSALGFAPERLRKGTVRCALGGRGRPAVLAAHVDTLGLMVREIRASGRLRFTRLGGPSLNAVETETVTVHTRGGQAYTGVVLMENASVHVNAKLEENPRTIDTMEILLDELVGSAAQVKDLGIAVGDVVSLEPRVRVTDSGFIHSRFLDDKLSAGMLLALARRVAAGQVRLARQVTLLFTVYEEVGHGASSGVPGDTQDMLVVDMGCVGDGLDCQETQVSICAKDSSGPYDYRLTGELIALAQAGGIDYAVDVYPAYGSDAATALRSGSDVRFALIGAGVYASHGYERTHARGVSATLALIEAFACHEAGA